MPVFQVSYFVVFVLSRASLHYLMAECRVLPVVVPHLSCDQASLNMDA